MPVFYTELRRSRLKIALVYDEQKYPDKMAELFHAFGTQRCCQIETIPILGTEAFLEAFEDDGFSAVLMDIDAENMRN